MCMALANSASRTCFSPVLEPFGQSVSISEFFENRGSQIRDLDATTRRQFEAMADYCRNFLTRSHPALGRAGPVCPYTRRGITRNLLSLTHCRLDGSDDYAIVQAMIGLRTAYLTRDAGLAENDRPFHAIVVLFPHLQEEEAAPLIERLHKRLKPDFTDLGLMIGEFYPGCDSAGLHNPDFRPLQTPVPALVIRHMTIADAPFLAGDPRFRASYGRQFGEEGTRTMRAFLDRAPPCPAAPGHRARPAGMTLHIAS